jgi:hypothetical protein
LAKTQGFNISSADLPRTSSIQSISVQAGPRLQEEIMIKKVAGGFKVLSEKGKNLGGPYKTKKEAEKRLKQVEFFKHRKG